MKSACAHNDGATTLFCSICGREREKGSLKRVKLTGFVGVHQSTNPKIEEFWRTGDPSVFSTPEERATFGSNI